MNDKEDMQIKLSKLFIGGAFRGYALTVNGRMFSNQVSTVVNTEPHKIPRVTASFIVCDEMTVNAPDIHIKDYSYQLAEEGKYEDRDYAT